MPLPAPPPPPPPGPPPLGGLANLMCSSNVKLTPASSNNQHSPPDRSNLLNEIRKAGGMGGKIQLKKVVTNDRSSPTIGGNANGAKSSSPLSNGSSGKASTVGRALGNQMTNKMSFQEQLNSAIKGNKLSSSHSSGSIHSAISDGNSPQHAAANGNGVLSKNATSKPDAPRPLPPTPGSKSSTSPPFKGQAPSPPQNSSTNQQSEQQRRLRSLTATGAEITEPSKSIRSIKDQLMSAGGSLGGVSSPAPPPPPPLLSSQPKNASRASAVLANVPRPPPPSKPPHLISSCDQQAPPPPPSKPPSQKPPLDEVKNRRPDFRTIRPQRPGSSGGAKGAFSSAHRSNSEENIHQSPTNQMSPLIPNSRPAPPPPPQRPPPLPPALNRPSGAPPPPPLPKNSPIGQPKRPQILNGSPSSTASSESAPPIPPPRSDSLISEFEKRFRFRTLALLPSPEEYSNNSKNYGNFRNGRKPAPKIP